jgi:hypothetical protein
LIAQLQARDDALYQRVIEFAGSNLPGESANALIGIYPGFAIVDRPKGRTDGARRQLTTHQLRRIQ